MHKVTITISDTPEGGITIDMDHQPGIGQRCSPAQQAALEIISRTRKQWGVRTAPKPIPEVGSDIDAIHSRRDNVVSSNSTGYVYFAKDVEKRRFSAIAVK